MRRLRCLERLIFISVFSALPVVPAFPADDSASPTEGVNTSIRKQDSGDAPLKLYGRIEELTMVKGARLPIKLQAMTAQKDTSLNRNEPALAGKTSKFPVSYQGTWSGPLTVAAFNADEAFYEFDPQEARRQAQLLRAGTWGGCTVTFFRGKDNETKMQPCSVVFEANVAASSAATGALSSLERPFIYYLHLGDLGSGRGVTGNELSCQLLKNTLKELGKDVIEQEVITRDFDRNPKSGKITSGYSESVLRFTPVAANMLYLQAASVSYGSDARFHNKVILNGTLVRKTN